MKQEELFNLISKRLHKIHHELTNGVEIQSYRIQAKEYENME